MADKVLNMNNITKKNGDDKMKSGVIKSATAHTLNR